MKLDGIIKVLAYSPYLAIRGTMPGLIFIIYIVVLDSHSSHSTFGLILGMWAVLGGLIYSFVTEINK